MERELKVMVQYRIGIRPFGDGWRPDLSKAELSVKQKVMLSRHLDGTQVYPSPMEAIQAVASAGGLADFP